MVTQTRADVGSVARSKNSYTYNEIGQRTQMAYFGSIMGGGDGAFFYSYNPKGELIQTKRNAQPNLRTSLPSNISHTRDYSYDEIGNRLSSQFAWHNPTPDSVNTQSYTSDALNQYDEITTNGASVIKTHDTDGNLIADGTFTYEWDSENRLSRVFENGNQIADYFYDYRGRRVEKHLYSSAQGSGGSNSVTSFYYDGWNLIAEYDGVGATNLLRKYTWGIDLSGTKQGAGGVRGLLCVEDSVGKHYPTYDANGNVVGVLADDSGAAGEAWYTYDGFGKTFGAGGAYWNKMKFRFSTKYYDEETGFYYYGYRYYDPVTGRWPSRDPIQEKGGINLYGFVGNDGVNQVDVHGQIALAGAAPAAAGIVAAYLVIDWAIRGEQSIVGQLAKALENLPAIDIPVVPRPGEIEEDVEDIPDNIIDFPANNNDNDPRTNPDRPPITDPPIQPDPREGDDKRRKRPIMACHYSGYETYSFGPGTFVTNVSHIPFDQILPFTHIEFAETGEELIYEHTFYQPQGFVLWTGLVNNQWREGLTQWGADPDKIVCIDRNNKRTQVFPPVPPVPPVLP